LEAFWRGSSRGTDLSRGATGLSTRSRGALRGSAAVTAAAAISLVAFFRGALRGSGSSSGRASLEASGRLALRGRAASDAPVGIHLIFRGAQRAKALFGAATSVSVSGFGRGALRGSSKPSGVVALQATGREALRGSGKISGVAILTAIYSRTLTALRALWQTTFVAACAQAQTSSVARYTLTLTACQANMTTPQSEYQLYSDVDLTCSFVAEDGVTPLDPTVVFLYVQAPDGTEQTYTGDQLTRVSAGVYTTTVLVDQAGSWICKGQGTGSVPVTSSDLYFRVSRSALANYLQS
jgi:hypothetical protein